MDVDVGQTWRGWGRVSPPCWVRGATQGWPQVEGVRWSCDTSNDPRWMTTVSHSGQWHMTRGRGRLGPSSDQWYYSETSTESFQTTILGASQYNYVTYNQQVQHIAYNTYVNPLRGSIVINHHPPPENLVYDMRKRGVRHEKTWCTTRENVVYDTRKRGVRQEKTWCTTLENVVYDMRKSGVWHEKTWCTTWENVVYDMRKRGVRHEKTWCTTRENMVYDTRKRGVRHEKTWCTTWENVVYDIRKRGVHDKNVLYDMRKRGVRHAKTWCMTWKNVVYDMRQWRFCFISLHTELNILFSPICGTTNELN